MAWQLGQGWPCLLKLLALCSALILVTAEDPTVCREQEYKDRFGNCVACRQCDAGQELSKECGFGYGEDARCVPCRAGRFKEDTGLQKCKPCLDCAVVNRFQKGNCSTTGNALCGDCLPGYYRKTKLSGFQDMECIPCGDPPPPYEPHCNSRVNLVPLQTTVTSPRDMALAAVICSALASVLLALLILCVIYCKRQLLEKKPAALVRSQDGPYIGAELSCFDRRRIHEQPHRFCCDCHQGPGQTCGSVLIPSLCCDETCSLGRSRDASPFQSQGDLQEGHGTPPEGTVPMYLGSLPDTSSMDSSEKWPLMQDPPRPEDLDLPHHTPEPSQRGIDPSGEGRHTPQDQEAQTDGPADGQSDRDPVSLTESLLLPTQPSASLQG